MIFNGPGLLLQVVLVISFKVFCSYVKPFMRHINNTHVNCAKIYKFLITGKVFFVIFRAFFVFVFEYHASF